MAKPLIHIVFMGVVLMRYVFFCVWMFCLLCSAFTFSAVQPTDQDTVEMHRLRRASQSRSSVSRISNYSEVPLYSEDRIPILKMTREKLLQFFQDKTRFPLIQKAKIEAGAANLIPPGDESVVQLSQEVEEWIIQPEVQSLLRLLVTDDDAQEMMDSFHLFYYDQKYFEQIALEEKKKEERAYNREEKHHQRIFSVLPIFLVVLAICTTIYFLTINKDNPDAMLGFYIMAGGISGLFLGVLAVLSYRAVREDNAGAVISEAIRTREQAVQVLQAVEDELLEVSEEAPLLVTSEEDEAIACLYAKSRTLRAFLLNRKFHQQVKVLLEKHGLHIVDQIFSLAQEVRIDMPIELVDVAAL